ncbi:hypothetical protein [Roseateles sp.]|uniref:hypothetical protein n=1 Tax=Roseateles sp. TaxID=1971397 RepID=UPI003D09CAB8
MKFNNKHLWAATLALVWAHSAHAISIRFDFPQAARDSTVIAQLEIETAEHVRAPSGASCGTRYTARILDGIKGVATGSRIEFGFFTGHAVGAQYFVFLKDSAVLAQHKALAPEARVPMTSPISYSEECKKLLPRFIETGEGMGTLAILPSRQSHAPNEPAVTLEAHLYPVPLKLPVAFWHEGLIFEGELLGTVEFSVENFSRYLRLLLSPAEQP